MSATNGSWSAAGLSSAQARIGAVDERPQRGQRDDQHDAAEDQGEDEELEEPDQPAAAAATVRRRVALRDGSEDSGIDSVA